MMLLAAFLLASASADSQVHSLNDLPSTWNGVAGDLFHRASASLRWTKAKETERDENSKGYSAEYELEGTLWVGGTQRYLFKKVRLAHQNAHENLYELIISVEDSLVGPLLLSIVHDPEEEKFTLGEILKSGDRRLLLTAKED